MQGETKKYFHFIWGNRRKIDLHMITAKHLGHCRKRSFKKLWPQWDLNPYICFQETSWGIINGKRGWFSEETVALLSGRV